MKNFVWKLKGVADWEKIWLLLYEDSFEAENTVYLRRAIDRSKRDWEGRKVDEMQVFKNLEFGQVRVAEIDGEPWFVGKDIAEILGYENATKAIRDHVDEEDRRIGVQNVTLSVEDTLGRQKYPTWINEPGLYSLVFHSRLPVAKRFKRWVTKEVLPSIRKHGVYVTNRTLDQMINDPASSLQLMMELKEEREKCTALETTVAVQTQQIAEMQPKASYYDMILQSADTVTITVIAKDYGWSARRLNRLLSEKRVQYKHGGIWLLHAKYQDKGYTKTVTYMTDETADKRHVQCWTYWTQKGRLFLYDLLKADGILPLIERDLKKDKAA